MKTIFYIITLTIIGIVEAYQIQNTLTLLYDKITSTVFAYSIVLIYVVICLNSKEKIRFVMSIIVSLIIILSYTKNLRDTITNYEKEKESQIVTINNRIDNLKSKIYNESKDKNCLRINNEKLFMNCLYLASISNKREDKNKEEIKKEILELEKQKQNLLKTNNIDYITLLIKFFLAILISIFSSITIFEITSKIGKKEEITKHNIKYMIEKGYTVTEISRKLKVSRTTVYRKLKPKEKV